VDENPEPRDRRVTESAEAFRRDGWLLLEDVVDTGLIEQLHASYTDRHGSSARLRESLRVGHQRYMITVRLKPPFTDSRLYANPVLLGVLTDLLGAERVLSSFSAVVSYPGAEDQHVHQDGGGLFGDPAREGSLPPYAVTAIVPLVEMNSETGTTRVWPGSQRPTDDEPGSIEPVDPLVRRGSVLLMDYRLQHGGLANRSAGLRPILSLVFTRPWFRDAVNFGEQPPLLYGPLERRRMPPELGRLLPADADAGFERRALARGRRMVAMARKRLVRS